MHITQAPNRHRFPASIIAIQYGYIIALIIVTEMFKSRWLIEVLY
ncbi:hypothetical protein [Rickettsia sp. MEAM1 (Bemisia tabaci)]|nr:hypothetical protein [Rickettsia sp. MEAM1 (Bemisia tabaci)]